MKFYHLLFLFLFFGCKEKKEAQTLASNQPTAEIGLISENAMVVSAREEASKIGTEILQKGGNAFDAMIATEMALAVAYPYAGNLGRGRIYGLSHPIRRNRLFGLPRKSADRRFQKYVCG